MKEIKSPRIFALSDIHVDYLENMLWTETLSPTDYLNDVLILGGDVSCSLHGLRKALLCLKAKFGKILFVPGNHELWVRREECPDSMTKLFRVVNLCKTLAVETRPIKVGGAGDGEGVWIVPLFSWYRRPEEGSKSLFVTKKGEDLNLNVWGDDYFTKWNGLNGAAVADIFLQMNEKTLQQRFNAPIISFSHFLPRMELMFYSESEVDSASVERGEIVMDANPSFNFSRVAGCAGLEEQIRSLGSIIHIYGHQHRNRERHFDGIRYISHCLGYPSERKSGQVWNLQQGPRLIWSGAH
ncbi:MAG TPA: metallophosphoesterase [Verrucomicrobiae bacterium]|nr:metallophosphoesterase [Verrucomicrobiae bacterium]